MSDNRLAAATSPYLLQHAHNPVDWYEWGPEALARAHAEGRPILLSIGYSACHWCHVMERESFEDGAIAALMNAHFVNVKVDREERPDLDTIYMAATVAMNEGRGGWPMTVFLTPEQEPFFAGTYFPPADRHGLPGFGRLLAAIARLWAEDQAGLRQQAAALTAALRAPLAPAADGAPPPVGAAAWDAAVAHLVAQSDPLYGGLGSPPKFPQTTAHTLLLRDAAVRRGAATGPLAEADEPSLTALTRSLDGMAGGGLHDHLAGGFARYSTDADWLVPHFEKMLYDNALLARLYAEAHSLTGDLRWAQVARQTCDFVCRELVADGGAFCSSFDADSEGAEGTFYVWTHAELLAVLGPTRGPPLAAYFAASPEGNWEGRNVLHTPRPLVEVAAERHLDAPSLQAMLDEARPLLLAARARRPPPGRDDKVLTGWNGLMLGALAAAARALRAPAYLEAGVAAAAALWRRASRPDGRLFRSSRAGYAHLDAVLEDYAYLAEGLLDLYEAGADGLWLRRAAALWEVLLADFVDPDSGAFFDTARQHEALILRHRDGHDGATPSPHATAAHVGLRLAAHLGRADWEAAASRAVHAYAAPVARAPQAFARTLLAWRLLRQPPTTLAFVGPEGALFAGPLWQACVALHLPEAVVAHPRGGDGLPLLAGRAAAVPTLHVCHGGTCLPPLTDAEAAVAALRRLGAAPAPVP